MCRYNYQLCSFMVMDNFGKGQLVQQSIVETNSDWHFLKAIEHFHAVHQKDDQVQVVIVDKDLREIEVLRKTFPNARILLCHFHVLKYWSLIIKDAKFGRFAEEEYEAFNHIFHNMTYVPNEQEYNRNKTILEVRPGIGQDMTGYDMDWWIGLFSIVGEAGAYELCRLWTTSATIGIRVDA